MAYGLSNRSPKGIMKGSVRYTRMESITAYTNERGQPRTATEGQSDTPVSANDMCAPDEWPSHACRNRALLEDCTFFPFYLCPPSLQSNNQVNAILFCMIWAVEADGQKKKKGRGVLKGVKASIKHFANGYAKLDILFSETLGGTVGMNYRSFKDDVVVIMKRKLPLIGVSRTDGTWKTHKEWKKKFSKLRWSDIEAGEQL